MARIWYGVWGDGRGHAARARAMVERLREGHEVRLFLSGDARALLAPVYSGASGVTLDVLPTMSVRYGPSGRVSPARTVLGNAGYALALPRRVARLAARMAPGGSERPDLVVVDFEPLLARAARRAGVPFASLDHQHALAFVDVERLPAELRGPARAMGAVVRRFHRGAAATIVSCFHEIPLDDDARASGRVVRVGVLLRPEVRRARPVEGEHLVAYFRRSAPPAALDALQAAEREVRVYGLGARPARGRLVHREVDEAGFVRDLASCAAVVSTAGNQLVGEAFHLGKPVLGLVDPKDHEQRVNAHFLRASGGGDACTTDELTPARVRAFLARLPEFRGALPPLAADGTEAALAVLEGLLEGERAAAARAPAPPPAAPLARSAP